MSIYKGGYITIDCGGGDILTESGINVPGVSQAITDSFGKVVVLSNVALGGTTFEYFILDNLSLASTSYEYSNTAIVVDIGLTTDKIIATSLE